MLVDQILTVLSLPFQPRRAMSALLERCVVAARTAPDHMQRDVRSWRRAAEKELRGL